MKDGCKPLGTAGAPADIPVQQANRATANPPCQEMKSSLPIRLNTRTQGAAGKVSRVAVHECTRGSRDGSPALRDTALQSFT